MSTITTKDGTQIFYRDFGKGQPILFSHGWPLSGDAWDNQMVFFGQQGYRVLAHDRRSHGRSTQTWDGNTMDQYADDLAELINKLELRDLILVGHSTGGGEITRYMGRHGTKSVQKAVLLGAVPPLLLKTKDNPGGLPLEVFDEIRKGVFENRAQYYQDFTLPFFGYNRPDAKMSSGLRDAFWLQAMLGGLKGQLDCIREFSEVNFTEDLKKITVPTLVAHGEDDQIAPIGITAMLSHKLLKNATLKVYRGAPHAFALTNPNEFNSDLLSFIKG